MAVTTKKTFNAVGSGGQGTTTFTPVGIELNNQDDLDVYVTLSGGTRVLQYRQSTGSTTDSNHPQVNDTTGLYFPAQSAGVTLYNYTLSTDNNTITFNSALPSGAVVSIERRTRDSSSDYTNFVGGSTIRHTDVNAAFDESNFTAQEARNKAFDIENKVFDGESKSVFVKTGVIENDAVTYAKIQNVTATNRVLGRYASGSGIIQEVTPGSLRTMINVEDGATADQTNDEIKTAVGAASDSNIFTDALKTRLDGVENNADVTDATNVNAAGAVMNSDTTTADMQFVVDEDDFSSDLATKVPTQQSTKAYIGTYAQPKDADLTTLAGMQSGTASILASGTTLTADLSELNLLDGKSIVTTISASPTDVQLPTAQAVDERITTVMTDVGGFVPIANETSFPATNPDVNDAAGTLISIKALASNLVSNGSGVATVTNGAGVGNDVTINGLANSTTYAAGKGLILETTTTLHTYSFHREALGSADVSNAQTLVSDFNQRYQVASSTPSTQPDGTALADGDLWFDTSANTMKVYDLGNTQYNVVTSVGDFKLLTILDTDGSAFDGANQSFNLKDGSNAATITSAGQLLISVNGVIQKPNAGTTAPAEGFALVDSDTIIFSNAPGAGASVFVTQIGAATSVNVPATNSIVEDAIQTNVVSEGKLKISNSPTNGHLLSAQSGNSGGLTWTAPYTHPNHSGEVTSTADGATVIASNVVDEDNLKVSNAPTNGYVLTAQSGNTGGMTWEVPAAGATGGNSNLNGVFWENQQTVTHDYTIQNNYNAGSFGPITINSGITVTVGAGESWTVI